MVNILYYVAVLLICVHYCGDDATLDRFLRRLREVLLRYASQSGQRISMKLTKNNINRK